MNDSVEISIVLPVYNVIDYLDECIKSILRQSNINFELIVVDDGSTDGSQILCDRYSESDSRIKVIHQKNAGLSAARNTGLNHAKGKYITFVDSDDFVGEKYIEVLYKIIIESCADISMCDYMEVAQDTQISDVTFQEKNPIDKYYYNGKEAIANVYKNSSHGMEFVSWAKMYKLELFKSNGILFPEGKLHEDAFTTYKLFYASNKIAFVNAPLYFYRIRSGSIMTSEFTEKRLDMIQATREEYLFFRENRDFELMYLAFVDYLHKVKLILKMIFASAGDNKEITRSVCKELDHDIEECKKSINIPMVKYVYYKGMAKFPRIFTSIR